MCGSNHAERKLLAEFNYTSYYSVTLYETEVEL
jgi:hypothetical protein